MRTEVLLMHGEILDRGSGCPFGSLTSSESQFREEVPGVFGQRLVHDNSLQLDNDRTFVHRLGHTASHVFDPGFEFKWRVKCSGRQGNPLGFWLSLPYGGRQTL